MTNEENEETFEIRQRLLGMKPFILVEFTGIDDETGEIDIAIEYGGGIEAEHVAEMLADVAESIH